MRLFRRKPDEDLDEARCPQCGERLPAADATECVMCGVDLRPYSPRADAENAPTR